MDMAIPIRRLDVPIVSPILAQILVSRHAHLATAIVAFNRDNVVMDLFPNPIDGVQTLGQPQFPSRDDNIVKVLDPI